VKNNFILVGIKTALLCCLIVFSATAAGMKYDDDLDRRIPIPKDTLPEKIDFESIPTGLESLPVAPEDNPMTAEKVALGRKLFFDPILSKDGTVSCATCHQPEHHFASPDAISIGFKGRKGRRNAPSLLNIGFGKTFFWDGRAATLEVQALQPINNEDELGGDVQTVIKALKADEEYVSMFATAFNHESDSDTESINETNLARAIASFERALVSGNSEVDRFRNLDYAALTREARQGLWIFESKGNCWQCHAGNNLTDEKFHNTGVSFGSEDRDEGRMEATGDEKDRFAFKTPSLRGVAKTAPYMHDGSMKTLREIVEFYNRGGSQNDEMLDKRLKPLNLSDEEIGFVVEYLKSQSK
jgi:cytochrome c peroxidase